MNSCIAPLTLAVFLAGVPAAAQDAPSPAASDEAMSCEQIAAQLMATVGGTMSAANEQVRLARVGQPDAADEVINQATGIASAMLPNAAMTIIGMAETARQEQRQREIDAAQQRLDQIDAQQDAQLDRLDRLHRLHEQRCASPRPERN